MSWFDDTYGAIAAPALFRFLGDSRHVTLTAADGTITRLYGILTNIGMEDEEDVQIGRRRRRQREFLVSSDRYNVRGGAETPELKMTALIGDENWSVESIEAESPSITKFVLVQLDVSERTRDGFRRE